MPSTKRPKGSLTESCLGKATKLTSPCSIAAAGQFLAKSKGHSPLPYSGLWDTGATCTLISKRVLAEVGLNIEGYESNVGHAQGTAKMVPVVYISVELPNGIRFATIRALVGEPSNCDVLIGMDIIGEGDFAITHPGGNTKLSYRTPSKS